MSSKLVYLLSMLPSLLTILLFLAAFYPVVLVIKLLMRLRVYVELLIDKEEAAAEARNE